MNISKKLTSVFAAALLSLSGCSVSVPMLPTETAAVPEVVPSEIRPQDDYYGYVNAEQLLNTLPEYGENSSGSFADVEQVTEDQLFAILDEIIESGEDYAPGSTEQLVRDMYLQGMAFDDNASVMADIREQIEHIRSVSDIVELLELWIQIRKSYGVPDPIGLRPRKDVFNRGEYMLIISQISAVCDQFMEDLYNSDSASISAKSYITDMLMPFTGSREEAESLATDAIYLMLDIAYATDYSVQHAANPYATLKFVTDSEMSEIFTNIPGTVLSLTYGIDENPYGGYYIQDKSQLEKLNELLTNDNLEQWKTILISSLVSANTDFLWSEAPSLSTYGDSTGNSKRFMIADSVISAFDSGIGHLYADRYYNEEMDTSLRGMCDMLRESYRELINGADWLSREGRDGLLRKLDSMTFILGGGETDPVNPADASLIADTYSDTLRLISECDFEKERAYIGQPCDLEQPEMSAHTVNACYDPANIVTITVAIMQPPFFDPDASYAANLGGLGMVVGHEMGHAFDSMCMNYNEKGEYDPEWLSEADRKVLSERADALTEYYSRYTVLDIYHVDGFRTNGENYADLGAMECITNCVDTDAELEELFRNYAVIWAENIVDTMAVDLLNNDEHSPSKIRVNAVLSSCDKFYELYGVQEGDGMYKSPEERVSRW